MIDNQELYDKVKLYADQVYKKPSAYKSGFIVKMYKRQGGTYSNDKKEKSLKRWFKEAWQDIGNKSYPVFRPTIRVNEKTPLLESEIDPDQLEKQIKLKQKIKGNQNLPKFKENTMKQFINLDVSDKQTKKYVFIYSDNNKIHKIHFGSKNSSTYLNHHDKSKRYNYLKRHKALGENWNEINAGSLSAFILWGDSTDLKTNLYNYLNHFSIIF